MFGEGDNRACLAAKKDPKTLYSHTESATEAILDSYEA